MSAQTTAAQTKALRVNKANCTARCVFIDESYGRGGGEGRGRGTGVRLVAVAVGEAVVVAVGVPGGSRGVGTA